MTRNRKIYVAKRINLLRSREDFKSVQIRKIKILRKKLKKKFSSKFGFNIAFAFDKLYMGRKSEIPYSPSFRVKRAPRFNPRNVLKKSQIKSHSVTHLIRSYVFNVL